MATLPEILADLQQTVSLEKMAAAEGRTDSILQIVGEIHSPCSFLHRFHSQIFRKFLCWMPQVSLASDQGSWASSWTVRCHSHPLCHSSLVLPSNIHAYSTLELPSPDSRVDCPRAISRLPGLSLIFLHYPQLGCPSSFCHLVPAFSPSSLCIRVGAGSWKKTPKSSSLEAPALHSHRVFPRPSTSPAHQLSPVLS